MFFRLDFFELNFIFLEDVLNGDDRKDSKFMH